MKTPESCQSLMIGANDFRCTAFGRNTGKLPHEIRADDVRTIARVAHQLVEHFLVVAHLERAVRVVLQAQLRAVLPIVRRLRV